MFEKRELLRGTKKELENYFFNEVGIIKGLKNHENNIDYIEKNPDKNIYYFQLPSSIDEQLTKLGSGNKIGLIAYLKYELPKEPSIKINVHLISEFVFIVDEKIQELF